MSTPPDPLAGARARPSSPPVILARLDGELRSMSSPPPPPGEPPAARAYTRNLVVVGGTPDIAEECLPIVDQVLAAIPARAIVIGLDPDGPDGLEGGASAVCAVPEGGAGAVCSERVHLVARGEVCARLASCVDTLTGTDLPTTLVWLARVHPADPAFAPLASRADRIVLDAARGSIGGLAQLVRWVQSRPEGDRPGVADLAWTRLSPWQELCARVFDEPRLRELASRVTRVSIVQGSAAGAPLGAEGGLLLGWLATRLGWKAASLAGRLRLVGPRGPVQALLCSDASAKALRGAITAIEIEARAPGAPDRGEQPLSLRASVTKESPDGDAAMWRLEVQDGTETRRIEQRVPLHAHDQARLLETTLRRPAHDPALAESVAWTDELRGEELACG
ncbi:MAG: glucose-6-phosphate dehydrogenase assembly protein OpcA [Myxococcales bacterium]|nr:glucose-6-phosphate dehydrogenase assembly protein OpcA [Myxococcales bacterium]